MASLAVLAVWAVLDRQSTGDRRRYHDKEFRVAHVLDGDTLDIDIPDGRRATTRVRLWGVDTPEVAGSPAGVMYFGPEASAYTKQHLTDRSVRVVLAPTQTRDIYNRLLAFIYFTEGEERMLNEALVETGHAYSDWRFDHPFRRRFETLEKRAQAAHVGLWGQVASDQMPAWRQRMETARSQNKH